MTVTVVSGGQTWVGMMRLNIRRSMDSSHHTMSLVTTDRYQEGVSKWNVRGGSDIQVYWNRDLLFDGFVNRYNPSFSETSHTVSLEAETRAVDLSECSHEGPYFWKNVSAEAIISQVLGPYSFDVDISKELKSIGPNGFRAAVDDSAFHIVQKIAEKNGLTVFTGNDGRIKISDGSDAPVMSALSTGDYTQFSADHQISRAYSKLIVKSQKNVKVDVSDFGSTGTGARKQTEKYKSFSGVQRFEKVITNVNQPRYRPLVIIHNGEVADVRDFADYAKQRFTGDSVSASITVQSIYDKNGELWGINQLLPITEAGGDLRETLIISDYELSIDEASGIEMSLTLREPNTYKRDVISSTSLRRTLRRSGSVFGELFRGIFNV